MELIPLFSIPGRIRLKEKTLKRNKNLVTEIENTLSEISFVSFVRANSKTGNILIIYDEKKMNQGLLIDLLNKQVNLKANQEFDNTTKKEEKMNQRSSQNHKQMKFRFVKLFMNEISLVKRVLIYSVFVAMLCYIKSLPVFMVGILFGEFSFLLFSVVYFYLNYTKEALEINQIYISKYLTIKKILKVRRILFHRNSVFNKNHYKGMSDIQIESGVALGKLKDPIKLETENLVKNLRKLGILDIEILKDAKDDSFIQYGTKRLGLANPSKKESLQDGEFELLILERNVKDFHSKSKMSNQRIITQISQIPRFPSVDIRCNNLCDISRMISYCRCNNEYLIRVQLVSVTTYVFTSMLLLFEHLQVGLFIWGYVLYLLGSIWYLRSKILKNYEEKLYGRQNKFRYA